MATYRVQTSGGTYEIETADAPAQTQQQASPYAKPGPYLTKLPPGEEQQFQSWVKQNKVPFDPSANADYDMRGYWADNKGHFQGTQQKGDGLHFPDTYKTPYHKSFSNESRYATPDAPHWAGDRLVDKSGKVLVDESAISQPPAQKSAGPDVFEKAVNYHTGNTLVDAPLGLVQGFAKGAASTGVGIGSLARKVAGLPPLPADTYKADTEATNNWQGVGKFAEQTAEFAIPGSSVGKALKSSGPVMRMIAQGATAGAVGAAQSGGDPLATGVSAGFGGAGELVGPAFSKAKSLLGNKAPTLQNFAESFGNATPTQKARISSALDTLKKDGIKPGADVHEMQDAIKSKLGDLGQAYKNLDPTIASRKISSKVVIQQLQNEQQGYMQRGVVTNAQGYNAIQDQIDIVKQIATQGKGLHLDDLVHLKQLANGRTNFQSPDIERQLWNKIGNAYRSAADTVAPETTPLNRDFQKYKDLEQVIDQNISRGKGTTKSGLDALGEHVSARHVGAGIGAMLGGAPGAVVGSMVAPKVAKTAQQMLQNAIDNGAFQSLTKGSQALASAAARMGDTKTLLRVLSTGALKETAREAATPSQ